MNYKKQILEKIANNQEVVGVIGLGYVGLPLAVNFAEAGIKTLGFDKTLRKLTKSTTAATTSKTSAMQC